MLKSDHRRGTYCTTGKFDGNLNLVFWRSAFTAAEVKSAKISIRYDDPVYQSTKRKSA